MYNTRAQAPPPDLFIPEVEDDTEEAPWMVMGDAQFWAASSLAHALSSYAEALALPWYVAGMLPILYRRPGEGRPRQVAPDVLVAFVPRRRRESYDPAVEGVFPAFVLEVISESSVARDVDKKPDLYEALGAREFALFDPEQRWLRPPLQGYRRNAAGRFEAWQPHETGRLWSEVLGLWLVAEGDLVRALDADGRPLLTPRESEAARRRAEDDLARLRAMLEQDVEGQKGPG